MPFTSMFKRGQGAFEYLLLIGGVLFLAVAVIMILRGNLLTTGEGVIKQGTSMYQGALWSFEMDDGGPFCPDKTKSGLCNSLFQYCRRGVLVSDCAKTKCGCPSGTQCVDGNCTKPASPPQNLFHPTCLYFEPIWNGSKCVCNSTSCGSGTCGTNGECTDKCTDGTPVGLCALNKPYYCAKVGEATVENCTECGCLDGKTCDKTTGKCMEKCSDGTMLNNCNTKKQYCIKQQNVFFLQQCTINEKCTNGVGCECLTGRCFDNQYCNNGVWQTCGMQVCNAGVCKNCNATNKGVCTTDCNLTSFDCCPDDLPIWDSATRKCIKYDNPEECTECWTDNLGNVCYGDAIFNQEGKLSQVCGSCGFVGCIGNNYCNGTTLINNHCVCNANKCNSNQMCNNTGGNCISGCILGNDKNTFTDIGKCIQLEGNQLLCVGEGQWSLNDCRCTGTTMENSTGIYLCNTTDGSWITTAEKINLLPRTWTRCATCLTTDANWTESVQGTPTSIVFTTPTTNIYSFQYYQTDITQEYQEMMAKGYTSFSISLTVDAMPIVNDTDFSMCLLNQIGARFCFKQDKENDCMDWDQGIYNIQKNDIMVRSNNPCSGNFPFNGNITKVEFVPNRGTASSDKIINVTKFEIIFNK